MCRLGSGRAEPVDDAWLPVDIADEDLDAIDALIAEAVFDSREEAVECFLRAGMEWASRASARPESVPATDGEDASAD